MPRKPSPAPASAAPSVVPLRNLGGRPPHVPTAPLRELVQLALAAGYTLEQAARAVGISPPTLKAHYAEEIEVGGDRLNLKIAGNLARIATSATHPKAVTAAIWWTKARMKWQAPRASEEPEDDPDAEEEGPGGVVVRLRIGERRAAE